MSSTRPPDNTYADPNPRINAIIVMTMGNQAVFVSSPYFSYPCFNFDHLLPSVNVTRNNEATTTVMMTLPVVKLTIKLVFPKYQISTGITTVRFYIFT